MRMSDWSSDVCSSDLEVVVLRGRFGQMQHHLGARDAPATFGVAFGVGGGGGAQRTGLILELAQREQQARRQAIGHRRQQQPRSEEHTSELQSLMRSSYAVFCLKKKNKTEKKAQ